MISSVSAKKRASCIRQPKESPRAIQQLIKGHLDLGTSSTITYVGGLVVMEAWWVTLGQSHALIINEAIITEIGLRQLLK